MQRLASAVGAGNRSYLRKPWGTASFVAVAILGWSCAVVVALSSCFFKPNWLCSTVVCLRGCWKLFVCRGMYRCYFWRRAGACRSKRNEHKDGTLPLIYVYCGLQISADSNGLWVAFGLLDSRVDDDAAGACPFAADRGEWVGCVVMRFSGIVAGPRVGGSRAREAVGVRDQ